MRGYEQGQEQLPASGWLVVANTLPQLQELADRQAQQFLGGIALKGMRVEAPPDAGVEGTSLLAAAQLAALGDAESRQLLRTNAATDVAERLFKAGHQTEVKMQAVNGVFKQHDRELVNIYKNTLEHTTLNGEMLGRTRTEIRNLYGLQELHKLGLLQDNWALVLSAASTTMSLKEKESYGFYADTESCSIQLLSAEGDTITLQTALVAGKATPESERHDLAAIETLLRDQGADMPARDPAELLGNILLVPKAQISGVEDVVALYDQAAGGTFYGEAKPRQPYRAYAQECLRRAASFDDIVDVITEQLIREAHTFISPLDANMRLDQLSEMYCVKRAVQDKSLNAAVFGKTSAMHIEEARFFMERGDTQRAEMSLSEAQSTANSGSCPLFKARKATPDGGSPDDATQSDEEEASEKKWMHCPYCSADVYDDPCATRLSCWDCTALVVNGSVLSKGNGGSKRRRQVAAEAITVTRSLFVTGTTPLPEMKRSELALVA